MGAVFKVALPPSEKVVALAMADHAHDDGTEARMGLDSLAIKCTLSRRQVQRVVKSLLEKKVIEIQRPATPNSPVWYRFILDEHGNLLHLASRQIVTPTGGHTGSSGVTPMTRRGDTGVTLIVKNRHERKSAIQVSIQPPPVDISEYERMRSERSANGPERARELKKMLGNG